MSRTGNLPRKRPSGQIIAPDTQEISSKTIDFSFLSQPPVIKNTPTISRPAPLSVFLDDLPLHPKKAREDG
jgi:hypothetical protein